MADCIICRKEINVVREPKLKLTRLGADPIHARCYTESLGVA